MSSAQAIRLKLLKAVKMSLKCKFGFKIHRKLPASEFRNSLHKKSHLKNVEMAKNPNCEWICVTLLKNGNLSLFTEYHIDIGSVFGLAE